MLFTRYISYQAAGGDYQLFFSFSRVSLFLLFTFLLPAVPQAASQPKEATKSTTPATSGDKTAVMTVPDSLMNGRVTFKLPKDWVVQRPVKQGIAEGFQIGVPCKEFEGSKNTANAAIIAEEQELLISAADFSEWKLKRFTGERLAAISEGTNWRTVLSKDLVDGTTYIIVDRFGVKGKLVAYLRLAFPIVKNNGKWENKLVTDYNAFIRTLEIEGESNVRCELVREEGQFKLVEVKVTDKKPKTRRRSNK